METRNREDIQRIEHRQLAHAERSLRQDIAPTKKTTYEATEKLVHKPAWWNVDAYIDILGRLGRHQHLHFFDINQKMTVKTSKKVRLNPMLPPLLESIVKSAEVKDSVKLPLAIRLDDAVDVNALCDGQGIAYSRGSDMSQDSRLLVFAAFNDQGTVVEKLLDAGFDICQLDNLIKLEVQRAMDEPQLLKDDRPPEWWVSNQGQHLSQADREALVETRWRKAQDKKYVYRSISWGMLPSLAGWTYHLVSTSSQDHWPKGTVLQQLSCRYMDGEFPPAGLMERTFTVISAGPLVGKVFTGTDKIVPLLRDDGVLQCEFDGKTRATPSSDESQESPRTVVCTLGPMFRDNVTEWLPLDSQVKFQLPPRRRGGKRERRRVQQSFYHWLNHEDANKARKAAKIQGGYDAGEPMPNRPMHELHRLYWAIRSNRPKLASVLMARCRLPIVAGIFSTYMYRDQILPEDFVPDARLKAKYMPDEMKRASELYACEILDNAELDGSYAAFDEFLFYGIDEEESDDYIDFVTKESEQLENSNLRSALVMMGVDPRTEVTNLDLALRADSKLFMSQAGVTQFLNKLWKRPSDNRKWVQRQMPPFFRSPLVKGILMLIGFGAFLGLYVSFVVSIPARGEPLELSPKEVVFWGWAMTFLLNEVQEAMGDFDAISEYVRGSGNMNDFIIICGFVLAFAFRLIALSESSTDTEWTEDFLSPIDWMLGLLCLNLVMCCLRFLIMLAMVERIGVMVIITTRESTASQHVGLSSLHMCVDRYRRAGHCSLPRLCDHRRCLVRGGSALLLVDDGAST